MSLDFNRIVNHFKPEVVNVYGCGGTGSWLTEMLARYQLSKIHTNWMPTLRYIDGDTVSDGNLLRQMFSSAMVGQLKVSMLKRRQESIYPRISAVPDYVYPENIEDELALLGNRKVVSFLSVDSQPVRKMLVDMMDSYTNDYILIIPGNEEYTFTVHTFGKVGGRQIGIDSRLTQPALRNANVNAMFRRNGGCGNVEIEEEISRAGTQLLATNYSAAFEAFNNYRILCEESAFFSIIEGNINAGVGRNELFRLFEEVSEVKDASSTESE